jgi:putative MATE family efflux protein
MKFQQRIKVILDMALPVTVGLCSSFVMAIVDLAMVGRVGTAAVAAVGMAGFSYALACALLTGITPAVQSLVSRRAGEGSTEAKCLPLNAGLLMALAASIPLCLLGRSLAEPFFAAMASDPEVIKAGVPYLNALVIGMIFTGLDNAFQGFWAGLGRTRIYMFNILFVNALHVLLNYVFIFGHFGFEPMGAAGAGVASTVSVFVSLLLYGAVTFAAYRREGFLTVKPSWNLVTRMLQVGVPAVFEAGFFALGFVVFYWIVGRMGTAELAVTNVLTRISILMDLFAQALGMTAVTLVSRSMGEGDPDAAERWGWDVAKIGVFWITLLSVPLMVAPEACLAVFLSDPATLALGIFPARLTGAFLGVASLIYIFATTLISLGDGKRVMLVSFITQWVIFLPGVWLVGVTLQGGLNAIMLVQLVYGALATTLIVALWRQGRWKAIAV